PKSQTRSVADQCPAAGLNHARLQRAGPSGRGLAYHFLLAGHLGHAPAGHTVGLIGAAARCACPEAEDFTCTPPFSLLPFGTAHDLLPKVLPPTINLPKGICSLELPHTPYCKFGSSFRCHATACSVSVRPSSAPARSQVHGVTNEFGSMSMALM